ncbi:MAG TPA: dihydroxyacetone kinase subunit L [Micromonosporaceae bacterium]|nr:dihydroxyacetone kinase subunit L [Micromonosporaceae bacterium]
MDTDLAKAWMQAIAASMDKNKDQLTQLDAAIGDGDHGVNMHRGFTAVGTALAGARSATVGDVLVKAGSALVSNVGGAAGPLYGSAFSAAGKDLNAPNVSVVQLATALAAGLEAIKKLGAATPGDKTIVDAFAPAVSVLVDEARTGGSLGSAAAKAATAAETGMRATTPMQARKGRAAYLGPRSAGHQDPGATSTALIFRALADVCAGK